MTDKYTLLDILNNNVFVSNDNGNEHLVIKNGIEIPMIQRDYAQGRSDANTTFIRSKFLNDIHKVLKENQENIKSHLNLDFVYGYLENETFIPLDGQQRLTTLYVIHWFLAIKDNVDFSIKGLKNFSYKTRQSAKEFLRSINKTDNQIKLKEECKADFSDLILTIKNQPWYNSRWNNDPSVDGFLTTLQDSISLFSDISFSTIEDLKPLSFHFLKIDEYGLGDNLYIKMNARGKPLSPFENFKATFESIINQHESLSKIFNEKIDGVWLDAFWGFSLNTLLNIDVKENVEKLTKKCDSLMLAFIKKFTEYLFYKQNINSEYNFNDLTLEQVYSEKSNLQLLIQAFNLIEQLDYIGWSRYFEQIFSERWESGKVAINEVPINFIFKIFREEEFSHFQNLLLFAWLNYITRLDSLEVTSGTNDFIRITRNYINNFNQKKKTQLVSELRTEYYVDILKTIEKIDTSNPYHGLDENSIIFRKDYLQHEQVKYDFFKCNDVLKELIFKFEDHPTLRGLIFNFDFSEYSCEEVQNIVENFYLLFKNVHYRDIIRLLLCFGNYSIVVGNSNLGNFKFLGKERYWHRVLSSPDSEIRQNFKHLFKVFAKENIIDWDTFIEVKVEENIERHQESWLWYCMNQKYKEILDHPIFTESNDGKVEIFDNQSLLSYHHNPFVFWFRYHSSTDLRKNINEAPSCAQYSVFSRLHLKNGVELEQNGNTWTIYNLKEGFINESFIYDDINKNHILKCDNLIDDLAIHIELLNNN